MQKRKVWVSLITPFNQDLSIDWAGAEKYVKALDKYDFAGFLIGGSVGEGLLLSLEELQKYIALVRKISAKKIMLGVIDFNYANASKKLELDYDVALATPCIYFKSPPAATKKYFELIANNCAKDKKHLYLYNNVSRVGVNLNEDIYDFAYQFENIIGVKECDDAKFDAYSNKYTRWEWITGNDPFVTDKFFINGPGLGVISTLASIAPQLSLSVIDVNANKDEFQNKEVIKKWNDLCDSAYSIVNPIAVKQVLAQWGMIKPYFRAQLDPLPDFVYPDLVQF